MLRSAMGLNQRQLARRSGIPESTISDWETGKRAPDVDKLERMCESLKLPLAAVQDAADFVEWIEALRGQPGEWRKYLLLRERTRVDPHDVLEPQVPYGAHQIAHLRAVATIGDTLLRNMLEAIEQIDRSAPVPVQLDEEEPPAP